MATLNFFKISKFFIYIALFSIVLVNTETLFPFIVTKYVFLRIAVSLAAISFFLGWLFTKNDEVKVFEKNILDSLKSPLVIAVSVFVLIFLLSGFFGVNPNNSFWSNLERGEGSFQVLTLYIFFVLLVLLFKEKRDWLGLFKASLLAAVLMIIYGILASTGISGFIGQNISFEVRFQGSLGNPAYVGTYLLFIMFFTVYLFTHARRFWPRAILSLLFGVYALFFWLAQTRGAFLGLIAGVIILSIYLILGSSKRIRRIGISIIIFLFLIAITIFLIFRNVGVEERPDWIRWIGIDLSGGSFQSRLWVWESALQGFKVRPILGWGPENFSRIFDKDFDTRHFVPGVPSDTWYDRAHSVFLDYLTQAGILGLLSYIAIFVVFYFLFFHRKEKIQEPLVGRAILFSLPIAYLTQGIVIFDVLPIYINLFLFLAFANYKFNENVS